MNTSPTPHPLGDPLPNWTPPPYPPRRDLRGETCTLQPLSITAHSEALFRAYQSDPHGENWTYLPYGPFPTLPEYQRWLAAFCLSDDPMFFAILAHPAEIGKTSPPRKTTKKPTTPPAKAVGVASYLRITPAAGSIEVGHINFSPLMQNTRIGTEAMYLMMQNAFALGYRRYEWKCNALNARSRAAARRLGFRYEGIFRQMLIVKGRNRDSAWYSILDKEWRALQPAFQTWLAADNFDARGAQRRSLSALTRAAASAPPAPSASL